MKYNKPSKKGIGLKYGLNGILLGYKGSNFIIHHLISILVIAAGAVLDLSSLEWGLIVLCIGLVLTAELINSAIEKIVDEVSPQQSTFAKHTKDIAAGAVLIASIASAIIGLCLFIPKLIPYIL